MFNILNCSRKGKPITFRIENNDNLEISLTDGKLYLQKGDYATVSFSPCHIFENTLSQDITVLNCDNNAPYYQLTFILNDLTNKTWYYIELSLVEQKVNIIK